MFPNSFPAQNTHRLVMFHPDIQNPDIERLEDITADGVKALRSAFDLLGGLPSDVRNQTLKLTNHVRDHLDKRSILTHQFRVDAEECLRSISKLSLAPDEVDALNPVRKYFHQALDASNRVADLIAAEHSIGWLRQHRSNTNS